MRVSRTTGRPLDWTPSQCAAYRGVSRQQWLGDVEKGMEPPPRGDTKLWNAGKVRSWKRPDEWFSGECAAHHGITVAMWTTCVRQKKAPQPVRKAGGRRVWKQAAVRAVHLDIRPKPERVPRERGTYVGPDPNSPRWTAKECADYLGIQPRVWRAAVRDGDAPQPSGFAKDRTRVWDPAAVMAWKSAGG